VCTWGRSDRRGVSARENISRCVQCHHRSWSQHRGGFGLRKTARLLLHLLGLLGDFLGRLGSLLCFLRFLCHVFLVGLVGLTNVRTLRTSARAIKLTRNLQKLYHVLTSILERCGLASMSSADGRRVARATRYQPFRRWAACDNWFCAPTGVAINP
jgi:hypothetical protein